MTESSLSGYALPFCLAIFGANSHAGEAHIIDADALCNADRVCSFEVTVRHDDSGWEHYANHWRVLDPQGNELGRRVLLHPHETEQPFTRSLAGIGIPPEVDQIEFEAHDNVHGYGGKKVTVSIPR